MRSLALVALVALVACTPARPPIHALPGDARLVDPTDAAAFVPAERYHGHVVVLDFWAGWCDECKRSVPQVARMASAFAADGLVVVGVNVGEPAHDAIGYAHDLGISYPIALDPDLAFSDRVGASSLPMVLVIDRDGAVVHRSRHLDEATLAAVRGLLHK